MIHSIPQPVAALRAYLETLASNTEINPKNGLLDLLEEAWPFFSGNHDTNMEVDKLWRIESAQWEAPTLSFTIERHGGTVMGSTRAERQGWNVNLDDLTAHAFTAGFRQLTPKDKALNTKALAGEIANLILAQADTPRLRWLAQDRVRIMVTQVIPESGHKQTVAGRRKRFAGDLAEVMSGHGWERVPPLNQHVYDRKPAGK